MIPRKALVKGRLSMKKIKIFTNHYSPENFKINDLSDEFSKKFDISVISQTPNYPKGFFFKGYSWFKRRKENINGIQVKRLPVIPRRSGHVFLILNYMSYVVSSFFYSIFTRDKADHVFVYITSPIFISWAGLRFAQRNKIKSTLYLLDLWPGSLISIMKIKNKRIIKILENMCINIYQAFDNIAVSSYRFTEVLTDYGINPDKIHYIPQHAESEDDGKLIFKNKEKILKIVFTGNIGEAQGLDVLVDTAKILKDREFSAVHFTIVGDGRYKSTLEENIKELNLDNYFSFTGYVDSNKIPEILSENHFGFVSLSDHDIFNRTCPAKIQSYMAYGIPILASANGEVPWIVEKADCGYSVPAGDFKALSEVIIELNNINRDELEKMSQNGYNYSERHFKKEKIVNQFIQIMKEGKINV